MIRTKYCRIILASLWIASSVLQGHAQQSLTAQSLTHSSPADLVLTGDVTGAQNNTYFEIPFAVPAGVHRVSVDFEYTGKEQHAALNLGIADPQRFRGTSGGNKKHFTLSETDATPSYLPGATPAGQWKLLMAVPNMRKETVSHYRAEIRFNEREEEIGFTEKPLATGDRWYRGDLHTHTAHSDGSCPSQNGLSVPCPLFLTVQTAAARNLDFIAITDHNTDSHYDAMRELQPYFDRLLLIPGREITTFAGHFNVYGVTQFLPYDITSVGLSLNDELRDVKAKGGIASVNHAESEGGEECMGCRWEPPVDVDMDLFTSVEVINGGRDMLYSAAFWDAQLHAGHRLAAIGGSDNHNATLPPNGDGTIGWPVTVIEATELSVPGILNGMRAERTFVDLTASRDKVLDFEATSGALHARMGETLAPKSNESLAVTISATSCQGSSVHLLLDGKESKDAKAMPIENANATLHAKLTPGIGRHWLRLEVRDAAGKLELVSSPIYINYPVSEKSK